MNIKRKKEMNKRKGQGITEYILMIGAVIIVLLIFLGKGGVFHKAHTQIIQKPGLAIETRVIE